MKILLTMVMTVVAVRCLLDLSQRPSTTLTVSLSHTHISLARQSLHLRKYTIYKMRSSDSDNWLFCLSGFWSCNIARIVWTNRNTIFVKTSQNFFLSSSRERNFCATSRVCIKSNVRERKFFFSVVSWMTRRSVVVAGWHSFPFSQQFLTCRNFTFVDFTAAADEGRSEVLWTLTLCAELCVMQKMGNCVMGKGQRGSRWFRCLLRFWDNNDKRFE